MVKNILISILYLLLLTGNADAIQTINLACQDTENFPFQTGNSLTIDWKKPGISMEQMKLLEKKLDIRINFKRRPWKRCLYEMQHNEVDGVFNASYKTKRLIFGVYPTKNGKVDPDKRSYSNSYHLFKLRSSPLKWDGKKFSNLKGSIGAPLGYSVVDDLKKMGINVHEKKNSIVNMRILNLGGLAGVAELGLAGDAYLRRYPDKFKEIMKIKLPLSTKNYYLMLSYKFVKDHPKFSKTIWSAIEEIRKSNEYKIIASKYYTN